MRSAIRVVVRGVIDLAVVVGCIACILHFSRRRVVDCAWDRMRASCTVEVEDSLGRVERTSVDGIRSVAYRDGTVVGLVTDAQRKGERALFGTREIELSDGAEAERLRAFVSDHEPDHLLLNSGTTHPRWLTAAMLVALLAYGVISRRKR
jgi:hypothetical protein